MIYNIQISKEYRKLFCSHAESLHCNVVLFRRTCLTHFVYSRNYELFLMLCGEIGKKRNIL